MDERGNSRRRSEREFIVVYNGTHGRRSIEVALKEAARSTCKGEEDSYVLKRMPPNSFSVLGTPCAASHLTSSLSDDRIVGVVFNYAIVEDTENCGTLSKTSRKYEAAFPK